MPRYDFPAVSEKDERPPNPGQETLYELDPDADYTNRKDWGPNIGTVTIVERGRDFEAIFVFDDGDEVTYKGPIPQRNGRPGQGKSRTSKRRGPDRFRDELETEWSNPKRWG